MVHDEFIRGVMQGQIVIMDEVAEQLVKNGITCREDIFQRDFGCRVILDNILEILFDKEYDLDAVNTERIRKLNEIEKGTKNEQN